MKSVAVSLGLTAALASALTGCSGGGDGQEMRADFHRICVDNTQVRVDDGQCPDNDADGFFFHPLWVYGMNTAPAVGSKVDAGTFATVKPTAGVIARPPASGGFGTYRTSAGAGG